MSSINSEDIVNIILERLEDKSEEYRAQCTKYYSVNTECNVLNKEVNELKGRNNGLSKFFLAVEEVVEDYNKVEDRSGDAYDIAFDNGEASIIKKLKFILKEYNS